MKTDRADKANWPTGPWQLEPDESRWTDESTGLQCFIMRGPTGGWCGYVGVPLEHPMAECSYYKSDYSIDEVLDGTAAKLAPVQAKINDITVHGGLTYQGSDPIRGADRFWFGFDCAHAGDWTPGYESIADLGKPTGWGTVTEYRAIEYVMAECQSLAKQIAAIFPRSIEERSDTATAAGEDASLTFQSTVSGEKE